MIAERRKPLDRGDLLSMLLAAQDEENAGAQMTDQQVRDEAMTIFLAGHETTANALSWMWFLLSGAPDAESRVTKRSIASWAAGCPRSTMSEAEYVEAVVTEAMAHPPAWIIGRRAIHDYPVRTMSAARGLWSSARLIQRDPRFYAEPDRFRRSGGRRNSRRRSSRSPIFRLAARARCIGESFAWMERCWLRRHSRSDGMRPNLDTWSCRSRSSRCA
jgi:cytochrome P450